MAFYCCDVEGVGAPFVGYFCSLNWPQKKKQDPSTFNPGPSAPSVPSYFLPLVAYRQVAVLVETSFHVFPPLHLSCGGLGDGFLLHRRSKLSIVRSQHLFSRSKIKATFDFVALGILLSFYTLKFKVCLILGRGPGLISALCF